MTFLHKPVVTYIYFILFPSTFCTLYPFLHHINMAFRNNETRQKEFKIPRVQKHKTQFEENFPFLDRRTPAKSMTVPEAQKLLKKVRTVANWLDNAVPYSPIPIGLDTFVVRGFRTHQHRGCCEDHICSNAPLPMRVGLYSCIRRLCRHVCSSLSSLFIVFVRNSYLVVASNAGEYSHW
jgi:hypothetical protein